MKEGRKRNEEMGEDVKLTRRAQHRTGVYQQAESERLQQWNDDLQQWDAQVNRDARHDSITKQQAIAGRMVTLTKDLKSTFKDLIEEAEKPDKGATQAKANRLMVLATGIEAQANNMRYGRDDHGWQPAETDGLTGRVEYCHPQSGQGARNYVYQSAPSRPSYSGMPLADERVDPTAYDPTARVWPSRHMSMYNM